MQGILRRGSTRVLTIAVVVTLAFAAGSAFVVYGSDSGDTYYGCLTRGGTLNKIAVNPTDPPDCPGNQTLISWNQQGQPGPEGPIGPQGEPGPQGEQGEWGHRESRENRENKVRQDQPVSSRASSPARTDSTRSA